MDLFFDLLRSVIYGVIEGITEWLPISSTGHMILAEQVLKFSFSAEFMEMFRVVIQLGAILAVVVMYFKKLWPFCVDNGRDSGLAKHVRWPVMRLWFKIIVACLPAAVLGLALVEGPAVEAEELAAEAGRPADGAAEPVVEAAGTEPPPAAGTEPPAAPDDRSSAEALPEGD